MFSFPSKREIELIEEFDQPYCLSIYAVYIEEKPGINPNKIQLKNMLSKAEQLLSSTGQKPRQIKKTLQPALALLDNKGFWHLRGAGIVLFAHPKFFSYFLLPGGDIEQQISIGQGFDTRQLQSILQTNEAYYVLAVSHNQVHFYQGGPYTIKEVKLKNLPKGMAQDLRLDEHLRSVQSHSVNPDSFGRNRESFHGHYNDKQVDKNELAQFFKHIDSELHKFLKNKKLPLIFAGVDYLAPIYKKANTYPYLVSRHIKGNPEHKPTNELLAEAWRTLTAKA